MISGQKVIIKRIKAHKSEIIKDWLKLQRRQWQPTPALLPGKSHGWRSLVGCSPWGREESETTEWLHFPFSLSCIGEGNDNPLQCSCLENPRDGGAWWAAVYGVTQSRKRLMRLSSSSRLTLIIRKRTKVLKRIWRQGRHLREAGNITRKNRGIKLILD